MRAYEQLPETHPHKPFPIGDVINTPMADVYISTMEHEDWYDFLEYVDLTYKQKDEGYLENINQILLNDMIRRWDSAHGKNLVATGFKIARSFMNETNLLPTYDAELRMALIRMRHETGATEFAQHAWRGMAHSHPRVFAYHQSLYVYAEKELDLGDQENAEHFIAGLSLPYMLSQAACLAKLADEELSDAKLQ